MQEDCDGVIQKLTRPETNPSHFTRESVGLKANRAMTVMKAAQALERASVETRRLARNTPSSPWCKYDLYQGMPLGIP